MHVCFDLPEFWFGGVGLEVPLLHGSDICFARVVIVSEASL